MPSSAGRLVSVLEVDICRCVNGGTHAAGDSVDHVLVDWAPSENEGDKLLFLFDCGRLDVDQDRLTLAAGELDKWQWVALAHLDQYVINRIARRVRAAVNTSTDVYLEHGNEPAG